MPPAGSTSCPRTPTRAAFYGDLFGWTSEQGGEEYGGYINFFKDGAQVAGLMAKQPEMGEMPDVWSIYLSVEDADAVAAAVPANGGEVLMAPMDVVDLGRMAVFTDAGGAAIGAWQPKEFKLPARLRGRHPGWLELHIRDFAKTIAFYETVFGWTTRVEGDSDEFRYSTMAWARLSTPGSWTLRRSCPTACSPTGRSTSRCPTPTRRWPGSASSAATPSCPPRTRLTAGWPPPWIPPAPSSSSSADRRRRPPPRPGTFRPWLQTRSRSARSTAGAHLRHRHRHRPDGSSEPRSARAEGGSVTPPARRWGPSSRAATSGASRWSTTNEVVEADPGRAFSFKTLQSYQWTYRMEADGDGTVVTESRAPFKERPMVAKVFTKLLLGGEDGHEDELRDGMRATLDRVKEIAEAG